MALVKCSECQADISSGAQLCPQCGKPNVKNPAVGVQAVVSLVVLAGLAWFFFGGGLESQTSSTLKGIQDQVASDSVQQYEIAARQGDKMQKCVQAGFVAAAYLQAKDDLNYNVWKATEGADCRAAGVSR